MDATDLESPSPSASYVPVSPVPKKSSSQTVSSSSDEIQEESENSGAEVKIQKEVVIPTSIPVKQNTSVEACENSSIAVEISTVLDKQNVKKVVKSDFTKNKSSHLLEIIKQPSEKKQNLFITTIKYVVIIAIVILLAIALASLH